MYPGTRITTLHTHTCKGVPLSHHNSEPVPSRAALPSGNGHILAGFRRVVKKAEGCARGSSHGDSGGWALGEGAGGEEDEEEDFSFSLLRDEDDEDDEEEDGLDGGAEGD